MRRLIVVLVSAGVVLAVLVGCTAPEEQLDARTIAIRQAVADYNDALVHAFATLDLTGLQAVATDEQIAEETFTILNLQSENATMRATLKGVEYGDVIVYAEDDVSITAHETWDYEYVSLETSETIRSEHDVTYDLRYDLVMQEGRWLVYMVDAFDELPTDGEASTP